MNFKLQSQRKPHEEIYKKSKYETQENMKQEE